VTPAGLGAVVSWLGLALQLAGCGLVTLAHDSMLGPVSPAGRIHDAAVGRHFEATLEGVTADAEGEPRLRPLPPDLLHRLGSPSSFHSLTTGLEAFLLGASVYSERRTVAAVAPEPVRIPALGASAEEVLAVLGPPDRWARFAGGATMAYRGQSERRTTLNLGVPPVVGFFIPIPGVSSLAYRRITADTHGDGFVLFFGADGRLERVARAPSP